MADKADVVLIGVPKKLIVDGLKDVFTLHIAEHSTKAEPLLSQVGSRVRAAFAWAGFAVLPVFAFIMLAPSISQLAICFESHRPACQ